MSESLKCAYCRRPLPENIKRNHGFCKCPSCRRIVLIRDRLLGMRICGDDGVEILMTIPLVAMGGSLLLALLGLAIGVWALVWLVPIAALTLLVYFAYDGYLSIVTRLHNSKGHIYKGAGAVFWGATWAAIGVFGVGGMVWAVVASILRGPPAR